MEKQLKEISNNRIKKAKENLSAAKELYKAGFNNFSINRSYYAVFNAIRAVNALDKFDSSKHSGVISYFNQNYVKTKIFKDDTSKIIKKSSLLREKSDYEDFYEASKDDAKTCIKDAEKLIEEVETYLLSK